PRPPPAVTTRALNYPNLAIRPCLDHEPAHEVVAADQKHTRHHGVAELGLLMVAANRQDETEEHGIDVAEDRVLHGARKGAHVVDVMALGIEVHERKDVRGLESPSANVLIELGPVLVGLVRRAEHKGSKPNRRVPKSNLDRAEHKGQREHGA